MDFTELIISPGLVIRSVSSADVGLLLDLYEQCEDFDSGDAIFNSPVPDLDSSGFRGHHI